MHPHSRRPRGTTLAELCIVMVVMSALALIATPRLRATIDRAAARAAVQEAGSLFSLARRTAVMRRAIVAVVIDTAADAVTVRIGSRVFAQQRLRDRYGVQLMSTRDSTAYDPRGLGYGAANLSVIARRGQAAETLVVSRLGRARH